MLREMNSEAGIHNKEIQNHRFMEAQVNITKDTHTHRHKHTPVISSPFYSPRNSALQKAFLCELTGILTT